MLYTSYKTTKPQRKFPRYHKINSKEFSHTDMLTNNFSHLFAYCLLTVDLCVINSY